MRIRKVLSIILIVCMVMSLMTGCASEAANNAKFVSDFKQNGKYCFHGLKYGMSLDEVLKKEKIKKSDIKPFKADTSEWDTNRYFNFYVDSKQKLYGINGVVRQVYYCNSKGYLGSEAFFYFDNEQKFLNGCEKIGKLLRDNFGNPYSVNDVVKYNKKQSWNSFINPPKFSTWNEVEKYNSTNLNLTRKSMPGFQWGNRLKEDVLYVLHSERLKPEKYPSYYHAYYYFTKHFRYDTPCKYYFIKLSVLPKRDS